MDGNTIVIIIVIIISFCEWLQSHYMSHKSKSNADVLRVKNVFIISLSMQLC